MTEVIRDCGGCPARIVAGVIDKSPASFKRPEFMGASPRQLKVVAHVLRACADNLECAGVGGEFYEGHEGEDDILGLDCSSDGFDAFERFGHLREASSIYIPNMSLAELSALDARTYREVLTENVNRGETK